MELPDWLAATIAIPAATLLLVICIVSIWRMSMREVASLQNALVISITALMLIVTIDLLSNLRDVPILGFVVFELAGFCAGCLVLYSFVAGWTLLFRSRMRQRGLQLIVIATLAIWWIVLIDLK